MSSRQGSTPSPPGFGETRRLVPTSPRVRSYVLCIGPRPHGAPSRPASSEFPSGPRSNAIHRALVTAFAAWMLLCCCEKRLFASLLFPDAVSGVSCCPDDGAGAATDTFAEDALPPCCRACGSTRLSCENEESARVGGDADGIPEPADQHAPHGRCCDGCCTKAPAPPTPLTLDRDDVGVEMPWLLADLPGSKETRIVSAAFAQPQGRPPPRWRTPRLQLVTSARLRI